MAVTQRHMGAGNFSVTFSQEFTPTEIVEAIKEWGHIVITPQEIDTTTLTDSEIKGLSIYTGIVLNRTLEEGVVSINGQGLQLYMGDGAAKGMVIAESNNVGKVRNYTGTTLAETLFNSTAQTNKPLGIMRDEAGNVFVNSREQRARVKTTLKKLGMKESVNEGISVSDEDFPKLLNELYLSIQEIDTYCDLNLQKLNFLKNLRPLT